MNVDREEQEDELLALHSIFDSEEFFRDESKFAGEIRVSVQLPADFTVVLKEGDTRRQYEISFLPPLRLTFELPEDYPASSPPSFTLACSWLSNTQLSELSAQLIDLYQASGGAVVLFTWEQFLKEDALRFLDINSLLELPTDEHSLVPDFSALSLGAEDPIGRVNIGQNSSPSERSSKNSQEDAALDQNNSPSYLGKVSQNDLNSGLEKETIIQNTLKDSDQISQAPDERETLETSEFQADSKHPDFAECDQSGQQDILNGGDSSAPSHPLDPSEKSGAASLPGQPKEESPQNENQTPSDPSLTPSQALLSQLLIYNATQKQKEFETTVFDCRVCYVGWLGSECVQLLECDHIFCRACLGEFCKLQIKEGNILGVTCPDAGCSATPTPTQVRSLVGEELFSRYDRLLLQMTLDRMSDVVYCPRRTCASAVILDKSSRAAMCSMCNFAFCVACRKTYHGTDDCQEKNTLKQKQEELQGSGAPLPRTQEGIKALWDDYRSGSAKRKKLLESRYGRSRMLFTAEEFLSESWISVNSKLCPHCFSKIQKISGCNSMTCSQCRQKFCWACLTRLSPRDSHFSESPSCMYFYNT